MQKVLAIVGTYRKGGIIDQTTDVVLDEFRQAGWNTEKIYLTDKKIEFCNNCRSCTQTDPQLNRGICVFNDDMITICDSLDLSQALIFASPINTFTVTAIMKRFLERFVAYAYWPWGQSAPKTRIQKVKKKAVVITSSACPSFIGRFLMPNAGSLLKKMVKVLGANSITQIYFGLASITKDQKLTLSQIKAARNAVKKIL